MVCCGSCNYANWYSIIFWLKQTLPSNTRLATNSSSSVLISVLYLVGMIDWSYNDARKKHYRGRPYAYSTTIILRCFIVRIWFRLDSNRSLHHYLSIDLPFNRKVMRACGLSESHLPSRRTFDRRPKTVSIDIKERVTAMGRQFVSEGLVKPYILAVEDSTLVKAKRGKMWHEPSVGKGVMPCSGIDADAKWGYSHTKGWVFGYKLHMVSSTGSVAVPLSADVTTANVQDNQVYGILASNLPIETIKKTHYMTADPPGYDDQKLYDLSADLGFHLVCPVHRYKSTPHKKD